MWDLTVKYFFVTKIGCRFYLQILQSILSHLVLTRHHYLMFFDSTVPNINSIHNETNMSS